MEFTEQVLVLKVGRFREADVWVRFFSPTRGLLTAFAFGGSRSRKRFCGCLDALNRVRFRVQSSRCGEYLTLMEGDLVAAPERLRHDWARLGLAVNCLKFLEAAAAGAEGAEGAYDLALEALDVLEHAEDVQPVFPLFFRAKLAFEQGYAPDLTRCAVCGKALERHHGARFLVEEGSLACAACVGPVRGRVLPLSAGALQTLAHIGASAPAQWQRLRLSPRLLQETSRAVESFVQYHVGLAWDRGRFRRV
jgi:DNA repair protein RecO (recombination protein O)